MSVEDRTYSASQLRRRPATVPGAAAVRDMSIGERVAWYRRRRGMSQAACAGLVGRTENWLSKIESGRANLDRLSIITALAEVLRVSVGDLADSYAPAAEMPDRGPRRHSVGGQLADPERVVITGELLAVRALLVAGQHVRAQGRLDHLAAAVQGVLRPVAPSPRRPQAPR